MFIGDIYFRDLTVTLHCLWEISSEITQTHTRTHIHSHTSHTLTWTAPLIHKNPPHGTTSVFAGSVEHGSSSSLDNHFFLFGRGLIPNRVLESG